MTLVPNVSGQDLADFTGRGDDSTWATFSGEMFASVAREAASSYCRGVGFEDDAYTPSSLRWVILMRASRIAQNYSQLISESADSVQQLYGSAGQGWTNNELKALDDYREIAA